MNSLPLKETKKSRVFRALLTGRSFNRFEAERALHDHCLHTTISEIEKSYQVTVDRDFETVPGYQGSPTRVCRYWINSKEIARYEATQKAVDHGKKLPEV